MSGPRTSARAAPAPPATALPSDTRTEAGWPVGRVTLQTVADKVGVSRMTVSNAFSRPDQLSASLRERILTAAEELGYVGPDPSARALAKGATGAVGILLTDVDQYAFTDEVATRFLGAIAGELSPSGLAMTLLPAVGSGGVIPARDVPMDGAVVYHCDPSSPALQWLVRRKLPLVFVDQHPAAGIASVNVDDRAGARAAAAHLVDLGHRAIGIATSGVLGPHGVLREGDFTTEAFAPSQRMLGWHDALDAAGIVPTVLRMRHATDDEAYLSLATLLEADPAITAVLCFSDVIARGVMLAARDRGLEVPRDLSVVGFDDSPLATRLRPALTTVRQDVEEKGRVTAAALTRAVDDARNGVTVRARHVVLPTELVVRGSTAPPRDS